MKQTVPARTLEGGLIEPHHEIEVVCSACGYDLDNSDYQRYLKWVAEGNKPSGATVAENIPV